MGNFQGGRQNPQKKKKKRRRGRTNSIALIHGAGRKKHVETMFNARNSKKYPFYYKKREIFKKKISNILLGHQYGTDRVCFYSQEGGYMRMSSFKSYARMVKFYLKANKIKGIRSKIHLFPDFVLTAKPKEVRMGKGKGTISSRVALLCAGQRIATISGLNKIKKQNLKTK